MIIIVSEICNPYSGLLDGVQHEEPQFKFFMSKIYVDYDGPIYSYLTILTQNYKITVSVDTLIGLHFAIKNNNFGLIVSLGTTNVPVAFLRTYVFLRMSQKLQFFIAK